MKRKIFTILSLVSLTVAASGCGALEELTGASPSTTTVTATTTESETETVTASETRVETARQTVTETRTQTETETVTVTDTATVTNTTTVTEPAPQPPAPPAPEPSACEKVHGDWSTLEDSTAIIMVQDNIYDVRIGRHDCFDRIVVDVDTTEVVGFHARYVPEVKQFGSGIVMPVAGGAALELVIDAPLAMSVYDNPPEAFTTTPNWDTLREVKNVGTFEGITKIAIGVDSRVKFGVYNHTGDDGRTHVVVDLVHPF